METIYTRITMSVPYVYLKKTTTRNGSLIKSNFKAINVRGVSQIDIHIKLSEMVHIKINLVLRW